MIRTNKRWLVVLSVLAIIVGSTSTVPAVTADPISLTIPEIQGDWFSTPYAWQTVETTGIVTFDFQAESKRGFFIQDPAGDGNPATSDGIFVYERYIDVNAGDEITIVGRAREYYDLTQIDRVQSIEILSTGNPLPAPVELNPPFDDYASDVYYETLEGMVVAVSNLKIVAGTNGYGEFAGVRQELGVQRVFQDDPRGTGELIFGDEAGGVLLNVRTGNLVRNLLGPLDYTFEEYKVLPSADAPPEVIPEWWAESELVWPRGFNFGFTVATYNMYNLFDEANTPDKDDPVYDPEEVELLLTKHARAIHDYLREPDLIAVQEVENLEILERLANTAPIEAEYGAVLVDGPDARGIDVGLLYRVDRVEVLSAEARQTCTDLDDGYGPGTDPNFPCEEGYNPLFSRPPLVVHLKTVSKYHKYHWGRHRAGSDLWLIINHFKSKSTYAPTYADTEPRRIQQAEFVNSLVDEIQETDKRAKVLVLGDLNSFENEAPLAVFEEKGLRNLVLKVYKRNRYTYIYNGVSEVLDHMLITKSLDKAFLKARVIHFNTDFPEPLHGQDPTTGIRSSDHDVLMATFNL